MANTSADAADKRPHIVRRYPLSTVWIAAALLASGVVEFITRAAGS